MFDFIIVADECGHIYLRRLIFFPNKAVILNGFTIIITTIANEEDKSDR